MRINRNFLLFWKDELIRSYLYRHRMIVTLVAMIEVYHEATKFIPFDKGIAFKVVINFKGDKKENAKAIRYLVVNKYIAQVYTEKDEALFITQLGLDAYNADTFLIQYKKQIRLRNNNRWMILFSGIMALGVVYSIYKEEIKKFLSPSGKEEQIKSSKTIVEPHLKDTPYQSVSIPASLDDSIH